jgi:hypothetical protein
VVWWTDITVQKYKVALDKPQRTACIAITRAFRTPPVAVIEMILGLEPIDIFIKGEAMSGMYRFICFSQSNTRNLEDGYSRIHDDTSQHFKCLSVPCPQTICSISCSLCTFQNTVNRKMNTVLIKDGITSSTLMDPE